MMSFDTDLRREIRTVENTVGIVKRAGIQTWRTLTKGKEKRKKSSEISFLAYFMKIRKYTPSMQWKCYLVFP